MKNLHSNILIFLLVAVAVFYSPVPADTGDKKIEPFQVATSYVYVGKTYKTIEDFIQLGRYVIFGGGYASGFPYFQGKGHCPVCHSFFSSKTFRDRGPNLFGVEKRSHSRIKEDRYLNGPIKIGEKDPMTGFIKGKPEKVSAPYRRSGSTELTGEDYLRESLICPNCYIVKGYENNRTKGGSLIDDNIPFEPMPANHQSSMGLTPIEIDSAIAWLQYKDDRDLSKVTIVPPAGGYFLSPIDLSSRDVEYLTGEEEVSSIIRGVGCTYCHTIPGFFGDWNIYAPPLHLKNNGQKRLKDPRYKGSATTIREYVKESIFKPNAYVVLNEVGENYPEGCLPPYFSKRASVGALEKIIDFIANTERPPYYQVEDPPYYIDTLGSKNK